MRGKESMRGSEQDDMRKKSMVGLQDVHEEGVETMTRRNSGLSKGISIQASFYRWDRCL